MAGLSLQELPVLVSVVFMGSGFVQIIVTFVAGWREYFWRPPLGVIRATEQPFVFRGYFACRVLFGVLLLLAGWLFSLVR